MSTDTTLQDRRRDHLTPDAFCRRSPTGLLATGPSKNGGPRSIRAHPGPHVPLRRGSSLYPLIQRLLGKAGVTLEGKRGPHTFRHARAVSLLRAAVPLKAIGDILGHRSAASTRPYLKLATEDLRAVGLEVPKGVKS